MAISAGEVVGVNAVQPEPRESERTSVSIDELVLTGVKVVGVGDGTEDPVSSCEWRHPEQQQGLLE